MEFYKFHIVVLICGKYYRQGEFLHGLAVVYASIYEIDQWWIGLTDLGMFHIYHQVKPFDHLSFIGLFFTLIYNLPFNLC